MEDIKYMQDDNRRFLQHSILFCNTIGPYVNVLGLDRTEITLFKNEIAALVYIDENHKSFSASFLLHNISIMRKGFKELVSECLHSLNYNKNIGAALGIRKKIAINNITFHELVFYKSSRN